MCLIVLAYKVHPAFPLIVAANRDEFLDRPTKPLHVWEDFPHILAGRDERGGGTWMGMSTTGRFAALTNHRDLRRAQVAGPSRGVLVQHVLQQELGDPDTSLYAGFNLLHGRYDSLFYHNNITGVHHALDPGIHGLSNHLLNTPWPKVQRAKAALSEVLLSDVPSTEYLFALLADETLAPDHALPDTGIGLPWERILSPVRIRAEGYGTRSSSVLVVDAHGVARFAERSFFPEEERVHSLRVRHEAESPEA
ncbi:MAG: NRDE family protein [Flavobacteriales bacterium]